MSAAGLIIGAVAFAPNMVGGEAARELAVEIADERAARGIPLATDVPGQTANVVSDGAMDLIINEKKSELVLSHSWSIRDQDSEDDGLTAEVVQNVITTELTLPLGGADNLLARQAFDGLSDGPSLSLSWTSFGTRSSDPFDMEQNPALHGLANRSARNCKAEVRAGTAADYDEGKCENGGRRPTNAFLRRFGGESIANLNRILLSPVVGYGLEGSIGLNRFNYRLPLTLAENSDTQVQFSLKAYGILFPSDGVSMLTGSVRYENSYEAQDSEILCRPDITIPNDDCVSAPPGPPENVKKLQFELEYRRAFQPIRGLGRFAIAPRVAFDALSEDYEIEFPIYLAPAGTNRILPGLTISYDSRQDDLVFGIFLRRTFSF